MRFTKAKESGPGEVKHEVTVSAAHYDYVYVSVSVGSHRLLGGDVAYPEPARVDIFKRFDSKE